MAAHRGRDVYYPRRPFRGEHVIVSDEDEKITRRISCILVPTTIIVSTRRHSYNRRKIIFSSRKRNNRTVVVVVVVVVFVQRLLCERTIIRTRSVSAVPAVFPHRARDGRLQVHRRRGRVVVRPDGDSGDRCTGGQEALASPRRQRLAQEAAVQGDRYLS